MRQIISIRSLVFYSIAFMVFMWPYNFFGPSIHIHIGVQTMGAWKFLVALLVLCLSAILCFRKNWRDVLGISLSQKQALSCLAVAISAFVLFYFMINFVMEKGGYQFQAFGAQPSDFFGRFPMLSLPVLRFTQPLLEEIVLRAILLGILANFTTHRLWLAIIAAAAFAILHFVNYYYGPTSTPLNFLTIATLFFFALAANALFFTFNHIGFGLVFHVAWNWWRFSGDIVRDNITLNEAQTFNVIEGSVPAFIFVAVLSLGCLVGLAIHESGAETPA